MNLGIGTLLPWGTLAPPEGSVSPLAQRDGRGDRSGTPRWWGPRGPPPPVRCLDDAAVTRKRQEAIPATGRPVRVGSLLPSVRQVTRIAPQHPLQLLGSQSPSEQSPHVHLGS